MTDTALPTTDGWRATYLAHQPVVDVNGGASLGEVADLVFDPATSTISGLLVAAHGRGGSLLEAARRAFGGAMGLSYIALDHVLSLNSDVVTTEQGDHPSRPPAAPLPRLSAVLKFDVITVLGKRLGQLEDLLLDAEGRRIVGYLIARPTPIAQLPEQGALHVSQPETGDLPEIVQVEPATTLAPTTDASPRRMIVVASDQGVRVGRDLIIVAGAASASEPLTSRDAATSTPFALRRTEQAAVSPHGTGPVADTGWQVYDPDAPTEEMRR